MPPQGSVQQQRQPLVRAAANGRRHQRSIGATTACRDADFAENHDLSGAEPERPQQMAEQGWRETEANLMCR